MLFSNSSACTCLFGVLHSCLKTYKPPLWCKALLEPLSQEEPWRERVKHEQMPAPTLSWPSWYPVLLNLREESGMQLAVSRLPWNVLVPRSQVLVGVPVLSSFETLPARDKGQYIPPNQSLFIQVQASWSLNFAALVAITSEKPA